MMRADGSMCTGQCRSCKMTSMGKRFHSQYPQGLVGDSDFIINTHREHGYFKSAKTLILPGLCEPKAGARANQRAPNTPLRVGFLGELSQLKAPDILAAASRQLPARDFHFHLGGRTVDSWGDSLPGQFAPETATFHGWIEPEQFFPMIDVLVLPSRGSEVFGRVLIEAYSHGIPVIGSNRGGIPEVIDHGKTGFVFQAEQSGELIAQLKILQSDNDRYNQMAKAALDKTSHYGAAAWEARMAPFLQTIMSM